MRSLEMSGATVEDAVAAALAQLGVSRRDVDVEVLDEPARGLFGLIGQRDARVRVTVRQTRADFAREFVEEVARCLDIPVSVRVDQRSDSILLDVSGYNVGLLIGRRGATLNALQYLLNVAAGRTGDERKPIVIDIEGYRQRRREALEQLARRAAQRARRSGQSIALEPMNAAERRIVHLTVQRMGGVTTESRGEEPFRRVVIVPQAQRPAAGRQAHGDR
ncbi:MAG TPA: RNA-binding cell elongation regulator Jag/EloR [Bacillota bacterium]